MVSRVQSYSCPCCGGFIGEAAKPEDVSVGLRGHKRTMFKVLSRNIGRPVSKEDFIREMYGMRADGGPDDAGNVVCVEMLRLRRAIEPFGWTISSTGRAGLKAEYRLIPLEAGA